VNKRGFLATKQETFAKKGLNGRCQTGRKKNKPSGQGHNRNKEGKKSG